MKLRLTFIILLFLTLSAYGEATDVERLTVNRSDDSKIEYYIFEPSPKLSSDVLLLILQGSDCNSVLKIKSIFSDYKNVSPKADLLLIEKYGIDKTLSYNSDAERKDCPVEYLQKDNPKQRVADINMVLNVVRNNRTYSHFVVIGGSEGAVIANLLAASIGYVDATISFNGGGRWFIEDVLHNIASEYENIEEAKESIEGFKGFSEHVLDSKPFNLKVSGHGYNWWNQMLSIDQLNVLQKVNSPMLIVQGGIDLSVSPKKVDEMIIKLRESRKENIEYITYKNLDHGFRNAEGKNETKKVIADMREWLNEKLNNNPNKPMQSTANASAN